MSDTNEFVPVRVTVCGGGRGGLSMAGDLALAGHHVTLFQLAEYSETIRPVIEQEGIYVTGATSSGKTGLAKPQLITTDPAKAFVDAEIVMLAVPGNGHEAFFETIVPHLQDGQILVVNTGYWASIRFRPLLEKYGKKVTLAETDLLVYLTRISKPGTVYIEATKRDVKIAAMPASENDRVLAVIRRLYPQFQSLNSVLEINFTNLNAFIHAPIVLMNHGRISTLGKEAFAFYREGATEQICSVIDEVDQERLAVAQKLGIHISSFLEREEEMYGHVGAVGTNAYETIRSNQSSQDFILEPANGSFGMVDEDIPYSFIPLISLAEQLQVNVTTIRSLTLLLCLASGKNYWDHAITMETLGLAGMTPEQIRSYVLNG